MSRMGDIAIDAEQLVGSDLHRLANRYRRRAAICRWTRRRTGALMLTEAERLVRQLAKSHRAGAPLNPIAVQPTTGPDDYVKFGYELGAAEAYATGYIDGLTDAAQADARAADALPAVLGDAYTDSTTTPAADSGTSAEEAH